jgi:hypothetical protein
MLMSDVRTLGIRPTLAAVLALICLGNSQDSGQERAPFTETLISNIRANPARRCNLSMARRVTFAVLARDYQSMVGRCVAVRGFWGGSALFLSARDAGTRDATYIERDAGSRIGLYGTRDLMDSNYARARVEVTAVGMVGNCGRFRGPDVSVAGFCGFTFDAPYLALAEMYLEP